ncbi:MAG TPA: long-chain-acyl-CoA synthetase [Stellaceae bacterium]|nr:long-chain-acyl-CoA synthetase [Stellaceae bacterium]
MASASPNDRSAALKAWVRALDASAPALRDPALVFPAIVDRLADRFGAGVALIGEDEQLSYRALAESANRYARWALAERIGAGSVVCLLMPNCPEYMAVWLGLTRVGAIVALINTNLVGEALRHCIEIVAPKHLIVGAELAAAVAALSPRLAPGIRCWVHGGTVEGIASIAPELWKLPGDPLERTECQMPKASDQALYIYTSGTTGLPKAAAISHFRLMQWSHWFAGMMETRPSDRLYNCLPMYHSTGGVVATGAALVNGAAVVIRRKFSASRFWDDVVEGNCTLLQYIGELCRYLVHSPPHPRERDHQLRLCCGNGLRGDVWREFQRRFRIPRILEFYAATEGSFSLYNCEGEPGAVGRIPAFLAHRFPVALIKVDAATGDPLRGADGFCRRCAPDEAGEAIGAIGANASGLGGRFEGYTDKQASERKLLHDVFAAGDAWYRTGDLMRRDARGYFYFVDRIGDTFRWKGENVSTAEVAETIGACIGVVDAVVYGVAVPGTEGRAGMATIVAGPDFSLAGLRRHLAERLPEYARPLFLRVRDTIDMTGTFKPQKQDLLRDGYDPAASTDALYFHDQRRQAFVTLDAALHGRLKTGGLRL